MAFFSFCHFLKNLVLKQHYLCFLTYKSTLGFSQSFIAKKQSDIFNFSAVFAVMMFIVLFLSRRSTSFVFSALYAMLVFGGQRYMKLRPKMNLRLPLVLWSLSLAIFR